MKTLDIMLPVYYGNLPEIEESIKKQISFFSKSLKTYAWNIVLAINGKNPEEVIALAKKLHTKYPQVRYEYVKQPGKGSGIMYAWSKSKADIVSYMDIDLSTDIKDFPKLIREIEKGKDISIGSRYHPKSHVERSLKRRVVSMIYHKLIMKLVLGAKSYTDAQCGFKAMKRSVFNALAPLVKNRNWFFESELLFIAQRKGHSIIEIPVTWQESGLSGLKLYNAITEFLKCIIELRFRKI